MTVPLYTAPHSQFHSLTARSPTVLCLSNDGEMGVAFVRDPIPLFQRMETSDLQPVVALAIFPLPRHVSMATTTPTVCPCVSTIRWKTPQTSVSDREVDVKKILWNVRRLRGREAGSSSGNAPDDAHAVVDAPGYLLVLRQENRCCYRLTWIQSAQFRQAPRARCRSPPPSHNPSDPAGVGGGGAATAILTPMVAENGACWEVLCSDRHTGVVVPHGSCSCHPPTSSAGDAIRIVGESWLRLDVVLEDIVRRRPKFAPPPRSTSDDDSPATPRLPIHSVDIVQVSEGGESLQAVICFMPCHSKRIMYAVFVEVDLWAAAVPSYREVAWLKRSPAPHRATSSSSTRSDDVEDVEADLARMAESLSLNQRMSLERIGPYSVEPEPLRDWSGLCRGGGTVEPDEWTARDPDPARWGAKQMGHDEDSDGIQTADAIPYDAIYPDCHVLNNLAVLRQTPVLSLTSRSSATEIVYG
jgi:hypothetical protein